MGNSSRLNYYHFYQARWHLRAYERKAIKTILGLSVGVVDIDDLCFLKIKSGRDKDLLDVSELKRIQNKN